MSHPLQYLDDEVALSRRLGVDLPPLRKFALSTFDIDPQPFLNDLLPTFRDLPWDTYDVKLSQMRFLLHRFPDQSERLHHYLRDAYAGRCGLESLHDLLGRLSVEDRERVLAIQPHRQRSIAAFNVEFDPRGQPLVSRQPIPDFSQNVDAQDYRALGRKFAEASPDVTGYPAFEQWLGAVARMVYDLEPPSIQRVRYVMHQMRTIVRPASGGDVVPEGVHQDGAKYIVSALVVERDGVIGGESVVYGPDKQTEYLRTTLQPGEGIFQADHHSPLWHFASPIRLDPHSGRAEGRRGIFGLDINVER
jgi:hypothetical protein